MITRAVMVSLCAVIVLSACSSPKKTDDHIDLFTPIDPSLVLDKTKMSVYISSAESQLLSLEQQSSQQCVSGQLAIAQSYLSRATAEHNADMQKDAFITLVDFDRQIRKIHCINEYVNGQFGCGYSNKKVVLKRWYDEGGFNQCNAPSLVKKAVKIEEKMIRENKHILITETLHDFNQYEIKPIYYSSLDKIAELLKHYPNSTLLISGHTDGKGSSAYNMKLSKNRAQSIAKYFTDKGIKESKITIKNKEKGSIRVVEKNNISRVFNRYTSITLYLDTSVNKDT